MAERETFVRSACDDKLSINYFMSHNMGGLVYISCYHSILRASLRSGLMNSPLGFVTYFQSRILLCGGILVLSNRAALRDLCCGDNFTTVGPRHWPPLQRNFNVYYIKIQVLASPRSSLEQWIEAAWATDMDGKKSQQNPRSTKITKQKITNTIRRA